MLDLDDGFTGRSIGEKKIPDIGGKACWYPFLRKRVKFWSVEITEE